MPILAQIYEEHAEECIRTAAKTESITRRGKRAEWWFTCPAAA